MDNFFQTENSFKIKKAPVVKQMLFFDVGHTSLRSVCREEMINICAFAHGVI